MTRSGLPLLEFVVTKDQIGVSSLVISMRLILVQCYSFTSHARALFGFVADEPSLTHAALAADKLHRPAHHASTGPSNECVLALSLAVID
jgi:hypothetical protein